MPNFINDAERTAYGLQADKTEILKSESGGVKTTTVYEGNCRDSQHQLATDPVWDIRKTVIVESAGSVQIDEMWAESDRNAWTDRATLTYVYR